MRLEGDAERNKNRDKDVRQKERGRWDLEMGRRERNDEELEADREGQKGEGGKRLDTK